MTRIDVEKVETKVETLCSFYYKLISCFTPVSFQHLFCDLKRSVGTVFVSVSYITIDYGYGDDD